MAHGDGVGLPASEVLKGDMDELMARDSAFS
jgi:hypothetical protein